MQRKVAVNTRLLIPNKLEGIGRFTHETLQRLTTLCSEIDFYFIFDRPFSPEFIYSANVRPVKLFPPARHALLYVAYFEGALAYWLNQNKTDLYFSPDGYLSLRAKTPQIPVFHDLAFERYPEGMSKFDAWHYRYFFPRYAQKASHILTVSNFTKEDIVNFYKVAREKITVCYNGVSSVFESPPPFKSDDEYFIYVGSIHPRKNVDNLLKAFEIYKEKSSKPTRLYLIGRKAWDFEAVAVTYQTMKHRNDVVFTGYLTDAEVASYYAGALALCYVSRFEGFGLPIIEAMRAGTAVIASDRNAMAEIAGNAALGVNPDSPENIAEAMLAIASDPSLRARYIEAGKERSRQFSWEKTASVCADTIEKVLKSSNN